MSSSDGVLTTDQWQRWRSTGAAVNLSARAKWSLGGADRVRYLNGQLTQDVRQARADHALYACVTNVKGRVEGDVFIHTSPQGDELLLDAAPDLRESLGVRLERYIIADDAVLTDVTEEWQLWHVWGEAAEEAGAAGVVEGGTWVKGTRFGTPGLDLWLPAADPLPAWSCDVLTESQLEAFRILQGVPAYPHELNAEVFPPEAGLEGRAMSFTKGCYIGQEVLSRIKTTGRMPKELVRWEAQGPGLEPSRGQDLFAGPESTAPLGHITSATLRPGDGVAVGLAYVKQGALATHSVLLVGEGVPRIEVQVKLSAL